jgi:hypothetical protein
MSTVVTLPHDPVWRALDWALRNCPSYITNDSHKTADGRYVMDHIDYFFSDEKDAIMFMLRFG